jgi:undecaprenyl-diphosphatase
VIEGLASVDTSLFLFLNSVNFESLNRIMEILSGQLVWLPFIAYIIWSAKRRLPKKDVLQFILFLLLILVVTDVTSSYIVKNIFERLRPCREVELLPLIQQFGQKCGGKYGFVSSHAANSFSLVLFSFLSLNWSGILKQRWNYLLWCMPFLVGYSRIYLGVHYPGDIAGGYFIGGVWAWVFAWFYKNKSTAPV